MKILFILEHFPPSIGGVEKLFALVTEKLSKKHEVEVLTLRLPGSSRRETKNKVEIERISAGNRYFFSFLAIIPAIKKAKRADIIHTTTYNAILPAWVAAKITKKKAIITVHEVLGKKWFRLPGMGFFHALFNFTAEKLLLSLPFDHYICVSEATKRDLLMSHRIPEKNASVIYNGIDYNEWRSHRPIERRSKQAKTFLYYGRPGYTKGLTYLLSAWHEVQKTRNDLTLKLILSKEPYHLYQKALRDIFRLGIEKTIEIADPLEEKDLIEILSNSDCVIIPSVTEGFGFNVVENTALENRIIATRAGAIPEVISGEHILCNPGNSKELYEAIIAASRGAFRHEPLKRFDVQETVEKYKRIYQHL